MKDDSLPELTPYFPLGAPISRRAAKTYALAEVIQESATLRQAQRGAQLRRAALNFNEAAPNAQPPAEPIRAGELMAFDLLQDIFRYVMDDYCVRQQPGVMTRGRDWLRTNTPADLPDRSARSFVSLYPPDDGSLPETKAAEYVNDTREDRPIADLVVREEVLLNLAAVNPAAKAMRPLFDDRELIQRGEYDKVVSALDQFFATQPAYNGLDLPLFNVLRAPIEAAPDSLEDQLTYIRQHWKNILPASLFDRLDVVSGVLTEEKLERGFGEPETIPLRFGSRAHDGDLYPEYERFSADADWMSNVVLIAKLAYVWLDQLSKKHGRWIRRLDEIPDEELDQLARWGFNGLWLIGVWERSSASEEIKKRMGNPEAAASAYSLYDYTIAEDLGGAAALENLRERAWARGIRLASDMVPNHVGLYSKWVVEHPDWFLQSDRPPFPSYTFDGPNLSRDDRVGVYIEDGYWNKSDAAVVFKRVDHHTGDTRYLYHGNDGTHMPWNDTAQLNYLLPDVREAVIQTILHVARMFPIIRFDAAMTLTKKHYQRLWFPLPGDAGAIPSRAECSLSKQDFDSLMPIEFWREVVDRAATEAPDTLLLAEAFWLMEGYFVRTLGMHRVYNSAFMNMIKMEENDKYRETIKNVLSFSPEILKRFVNFMNNPDERTAVEQFGKGDKYIGAAVLMATLPGLPMFGHGQIEGFEEKYGMEFRRAYWDEPVDRDLVRRHEHEIFPLLRKRYLFSGVANFALYDFYAGRRVNENVLAYSNRAGDERSLVLCNNSFEATDGWIRVATPIRGATEHEQRQPILSEALGLRGDGDVYYILDDHRSGLSYLRNGQEIAENGLYVHLDGYAYHVFLGFREVRDPKGEWRQLAKQLNGAGVHDIDEARIACVKAPQIDAFNTLVNAAWVRRLTQVVAVSGRVASATHWQLGRTVKRFWRYIGYAETLPHQPYELAASLDEWIAAAKRVLEIAPGFDETAAAPIKKSFDAKETAVSAAAAWILVSVIDGGFDDEDDTWIDRWHFAKPLNSAFPENACNVDAASFAALLRGLMRQSTDTTSAAKWFDDPHVSAFCRCNEHEGIRYFNRERFEIWLDQLLVANAVQLARAVKYDEAIVQSVNTLAAWLRQLRQVAANAEYRVEDFLEAAPSLKSKAAATSR